MGRKINYHRGSGSGSGSGLGLGLGARGSGSGSGLGLVCFYIVREIKKINGLQLSQQRSDMLSKQLGYPLFVL